MRRLTVGCGTRATHLVTLLAALLGPSVSLSACDGSASMPTAATQTNPTPSDLRRNRHPRRAPYTLSGVVFETTEAGRTPIPGVEVYCDSCGSPDGHTFVYTDASGFYSRDWTSNGVYPLFVTKDGYRHPTSASLDHSGRITARVDGDTIRRRARQTVIRDAPTSQAGRSARHRSSAASVRIRGVCRQA